MPGPIEDRYYLEAEGGRKWTISGNKWRRIFGAAAERACECTPLEVMMPSSEALEVKPDSSADDEASRKVDASATDVEEVAPPEAAHPKEKNTQARLW